MKFLQQPQISKGHTHSHGTPCSRKIESPRGLSASNLPSLYLRTVKHSSSVPFSLICGSNPSLSSTLAPFGGICIPAPIYIDEVNKSAIRTRLSHKINTLFMLTGSISDAFSSTSTSNPWRRHATAQASPPRPAPTMMTLKGSAIGNRA